MYRNIARHLAGAVAAWLVFCAEGVLSCVGLLVFAVAAGADSGGPLAGPFLMLIAAAVGGALTVLVLLPAIVVGKVVGRLRWVVAFGFTLVLLGLFAAGWSVVTGSTAREATTGWALTVLAALVPLTAWSVIAAVGGRASRSHARSDLGIPAPVRP
ncbi:hypothetical protein [Actinoplanes sp. NPDC048796]|uniref:hypothetical protein n=1 Tax=Actinoplanes sp. NPDC048796 TaxID=3155640 RepID=UPI0033C03308